MVSLPSRCIATTLLILALLGQGFQSPFEISSMAVFVMILGMPIVVSLALVAPPSATTHRFLKYNAICSLILLTYAVVGLFSGKMGYPSYLVSIAIYQLFYICCLVLLEPIGVWHSLRTVALINILAVVIQVLGGAIGNDDMARLTFLGIDKGASIEYWGLIPRASGLATEPAHLSYLLLPPLLVTLLCGRAFPAFWKKGRAPMLVCYLLTMSVVAYLQLAIALALASFRRFTLKAIFFAALISVLLGSSLAAVPFARERVESALVLLDGNATDSSSVFAIQSNMLVMLRSLDEAPLLGNGITSHRVTYESTIAELFDYKLDETWQGLNKDDAGSLLLLVLSEMGVVGCVLFLLFILKCIWFFSSHRGEIALLGLVHVLSLGVIGIRYGQWASPYIMLNLQVVLFCLAALVKKDVQVAIVKNLK